MEAFYSAVCMLDGYAPEMDLFETALEPQYNVGGDPLQEVGYHILQYDSALRSANQPEYGGGELTLPQRIGYKFESECMVCVDTELAMQHHDFQA